VTRLDLADEAASAALGARIAGVARRHRGGVVFLEGDLGAGKTTLARGLLRALGATGVLRSPTYTLVEPYELEGLQVLHADLYRLADPLEIENLGLFDDSRIASLRVIEWPERGTPLLPEPDLRVRLEHAACGRRARLAGPWSAEVAPP
jgi:tRNA threonylcarbamoyladenosine biosynthesis protein TsaE